MTYFCEGKLEGLLIMKDRIMAKGSRITPL